MPQKNRTVKGVLGGLLGLVGLSAVAGVLVTATVTPVLTMAGYAGSQALTIFDDLPTYLELNAPMEPTTIYTVDADKNPHQLATFFDQNRVPVKFDQVSPVLYDAILSSEDKNFYSHGGVNLGATVKAVIDNIRKTSSRGASTISQQYVKNVLIQECERAVSPSEENYASLLEKCWTDATNAQGADGIERKLQEMRYAIQIEKDNSKNDILLGYLNIANFGGQTYGIEAASNYYFGTTAAKLTVGQAATLAGIVQNPNRFRIDRPNGSWTDNTGKVRNSEADGYADAALRRNYVLGRMLANGQITQEQHDEAKAAPIAPSIHPSTQGCAAAKKDAYFCQYVRSVIESDPAFGATADERRDTLKRGGLKIYTTLDARVQKAGVDAMSYWVPAAMNGIDLAGTGVTIEADTGRILGMVQNTEFAETAALDGKPGYTSLVYAADKAHGQSNGFPPGSAYKLFTLIDWLEKGHSVNEVLNGTTRQFKQFTICGDTVNNPDMINNFGKNRGKTSTVRDFTAKSLNTGYLAMAEELDLCDINKAAAKMGVHLGNMGPVTGEPTERDPYKGNRPYETTLGSKFIAPLQMAGAFATVANKGIYCTPKAIDKIIGQDGKEMPLPESSCAQVISPEVAATAAYALQSVMNGGTGGASNTNDGTPLLGKTGTHQDFGTMMVESSTKATTAVWIGAATGEASLYNKSSHGTQLSLLRHKIAPALQRAANQYYPGTRFPEPDRNLTRRVLKDLPDVVGKSVDDATKTLEDAGFGVTVGAPVDSTIGAGLIAAQSPGAGKVAGGANVTISPSTGKAPPSPVPNVVGSPAAQASNTLTKAGFAVVMGECSNGDTVTATNPPANTPAPSGASITLSCE